MSHFLTLYAYIRSELICNLHKYSLIVELTAFQPTEKSLAREPNKMVKRIAASDLSIDEVRVLARIVQALRPNQKMVKVQQIQHTIFDDYVLTFRYKDLVPKNYRNYSGLNLALEGLRRRAAHTLGAEVDTIDGWITKAEHDKKRGEVNILIGKKLVPSYLAIGDGYTEYVTNVIFHLNSKHTINIYKLIAKNKDRGYFNLHISYLKSYLGIPADHYKITRDFRNRVLEPAYRELKKKSDVYFEADFKTRVAHDAEAVGVLKEGRSITGYRIRIINNDYQIQQRLKSDQARIDEFCESFARRVDLSSSNTLFLPSLRNWCKKYGTNAVIEKLESISGYIRKAASSKKLNYMQKALYGEFEEKSDSHS